MKELTKEQKLFILDKLRLGCFIRHEIDGEMFYSESAVLQLIKEFNSVEFEQKDDNKVAKEMQKEFDRCKPTYTHNIGSTTDFSIEQKEKDVKEISEGIIEYNGVVYYNRFPSTPQSIEQKEKEGEENIKELLKQQRINCADNLRKLLDQPIDIIYREAIINAPEPQSKSTPQSVILPMEQQIKECAKNISTKEKGYLINVLLRLEDAKWALSQVKAVDLRDELIKFAESSIGKKFPPNTIKSVVDEYLKDR